MPRFAPVLADSLPQLYRLRRCVLTASPLRRVPRYPVDGSLLRTYFLFALTFSLRLNQFFSVLLLHEAIALL